MLAAQALQAGIYSVLQSDENLPLLVDGIYDQPLLDATYPYVAMGDTSAQTRSVKDKRGNSISFDIHIWSDEQSQMQVKELMETVDAILHEAEISLPAYDLISFRFQSSGIVRQFNEEGSLFRGRLTYQAHIFQA